MSGWLTRGRIALVLALVAYAGSAWWMLSRRTEAVIGGRTKVTIAHWQIEYGPPEGLEAVIKRYEELNPHIDVEQVLVPGRIYRQWLRTNLVGGTGADILEYGSFMPGMQDVPIRYFEPLTELLDRPNPYNRGTPLESVPWRSTFLDGLYNEQIYAPEVGQLYSVTLAQVSMRLFANDDLLQEIVGNDPDFKFPVTFEEFRDLTRRINEFSARTGRPVRVFAGAKDNARWLLEFMVNVVLMGLTHEIDREGHLARYPRDFQMDFLRGRWDYERPEIKAALEHLRELAAEMRPGFIQLERDDAVREFMRREAVFVATGTWDATSLMRLAEFPVSIRRFPQPDKNDPKVGRYIFGRAADGSGLTAMAMYLNKHGRNKAAAIDFMHFMTSVEAGQLFMDHSGWISSIRETTIPPVLEAARAVVDGHGFGGGYLQSGANTLDVFFRNLHLLVGPQGSVDRFVAAMKRDAPKAQRGDLQGEVRNLAGALRPQDTEMMAVRSLLRAGEAGAAVERRGDTLETSQTLSEIQLYQAQQILARTGEGQ